MYWDSRSYARFTAAFRYVSDDTWGLVHQLEDQFDVHRSTLYRDCERIREALEPDRRGPKPDATGALMFRLERLTAENARLQGEVHALHARLSRSVEVPPERIEELGLTAVTTPPSYEGIGDYVSGAFGSQYRPSLGKVSQLVTGFGLTAGKILPEPKGTARFAEACCDELFAGRRPILTVVEPASLAIGAAALSDQREGERRAIA